jgi:three-Cys-motif partner protein
MSNNQEFGGDWTERKLDKVRKYLPAYMKVLSGKGFTTGYIDAFAGTGYRMLRKSYPGERGLFDELEADDVEEYRDGSARIALQTDPPFDKYVFIEKDPNKCQELQTLRVEKPDFADKISIKNGDANELIAKMCAPPKSWESHRAVLFLDPFGMQVSWDTIKLVAATKAVDLWYLFPIGSVNRLLEKKFCGHKAFVDCLDRTFGEEKWREKFYKCSPQTLLFDNQETVTKQASFTQIGNYIIERLKTIFPGVVEEPYILKNSKNTPLFMLCFAESNPKPKAKQVALQIARDILMKD